MKTVKSYPEPPMALVIKLAICALLCLLGMAATKARGQSLSSPVRTVVHSGHPVRSQIERVKQIYTSQIGIRETQPNSGREVESYLRYVNLPKGNPWCAAFVCWVYGQAGVGNPRSGWSPALFVDSKVVWGRGEPGTRNQEPGLPPIVPESGTRNQEPGLPPIVPYGFRYGRVRGSGKLVTPGTGDVFGLYFPEKGRIAHVGFVDKWEDPWVVTVEGNTNVLGSGEGDGVYRKRRLTRSIYRVARYVE